VKWDSDGSQQFAISLLDDNNGIDDCYEKGILGSEIQRQLGHKRYEPIWLMMHKIRISMGHRDDKYKLENSAELDEGFFESQRPSNRWRTGRQASSKGFGRGFHIAWQTNKTEQTQTSNGS
jgi:hypothetical protein